MSSLTESLGGTLVTMNRPEPHEDELHGNSGKPVEFKLTFIPASETSALKERYAPLFLTVHEDDCCGPSSECNEDLLTFNGLQTFHSKTPLHLTSEKSFGFYGEDGSNPCCKGLQLSFKATSSNR